MLEALKSLVLVPCTQLDPSEALRLAPDLRTAATGSIGAIGLALGFGDEFGLPFDFLNPKRPAVPRDFRRIAVLSGTVAAVALLMALLAVRKVLIDKRTAALREASVELSQAEKDEPCATGQPRHRRGGLGERRTRRLAPTLRLPGFPSSLPARRFI